MKDPSDDPRWRAVDAYLSGLLVRQDGAQLAALEANAKAGLPAIDVSPVIGQLLHILARSIRATNILEIGTLGGYSTIWLARALPPSGRVVTLEINPDHAAVAWANLTRAGVADVVELRVGRAVDSLAQLVAEERGPFDLIFIDADKPSYPEYLAWALRLSRPGTLLIADNVVRKGAVIDPACPDANVQGVRRFLELLGAEPRVCATVLQAVGMKGYDGLALALVK